ncbi:MAG: tRNA (adenosine(37)-N6)-threonylcarbamoyltransferase complex ATPase subunit type 1 TsaE [Patescibacteria group bacterium]
MIEYISKSVKETESIAAQLAKDLRGGEVIALSGNLGAGKTVLVRGLAKALGLKDNINSPTFVLLKVYNLKYKKIKRFIHVDCYRLEGQEDLHDIGLGDYLSDPENLVVIEWADRIKNLPANAIRVSLDHIANDQRRIQIS